MGQQTLLEQQLSSQPVIPADKRAKTWLAIRDNLTSEQKNRL